MNGSILKKNMWRNLIHVATVVSIGATLSACQAQTPEQATKALGLKERSHFQSISFADAKHGWAVGIYGEIVATSDGGIHWERQDNGGTEALRSVHFVDQQNGWITGDNNLLLFTKDGGKHWFAKNTDATEDFNNVYFADKLHGWIGETKGSLLFTSDGGQHWQQQTTNSSRGIGGISFTDLQHGWIAGGPFIGVTSDGGLHWKEQVQRDDVSIYTMTFPNSKLGVAVGDKGVILTTIDGGSHWKNQTSGTNSWLMGVSFADEHFGWSVGAGGTVIATHDGGNNWESQNSGTNVELNDVVFADSRHGWIAGDSATILATSDGGKTWIPQLTMSSATTTTPKASPKIGDRRDLAIVGYNYTNRYIDSFSVDGEPGGNIFVSSETSGGGGMTCCEPFHVGGGSWVAEVRWNVGACTFNQRFDHGDRFYDIHHFFKTAKIKVDPNIPADPKFIEVHFFPDGHVEAALTPEISPPRLALKQSREDRSDYPQCPNDKEPTNE